MNLLSTLNHARQAAASPFESAPQAHSKGVNALASPAAGSNSGTTDPAAGSSITANDFLTLLVTEIQNQDPTTQTDPMQYITQLVGVNSLEQLVQINQTLSGATDTSNPTGTPTTGSSREASASGTAAHHAESPASASNAPGIAGRLPLGSNAQLPASSDTAVAQAFTHASALPAQVLPPTHVPLNPEVMRALERSIPGATFTGQSALPAATPAVTGGAIR